MDPECERPLPDFVLLAGAVCGASMKYQPELARLLQPAAEVEGPDPVFVHEFEVAIVVASRYRVRYVHILDSRLQLNNSHPVSRLSQADLENVFVAVMMPLRPSCEPPLHDFASPRTHFLVHRFISSVSSVPFAVDLAGEATLRRYRLIVRRWYVIRVRIDHVSRRIADILAIVALCQRTYG